MVKVLSGRKAVGGRWKAGSGHREGDVVACLRLEGDDAIAGDHPALGPARPRPFDDLIVGELHAEDRRQRANRMGWSRHGDTTSVLGAYGFGEHGDPPGGSFSGHRAHASLMPSRSSCYRGLQGAD